MAAFCNATGLKPAPPGLEFPPCGVDDLAQVLKPKADGGQLYHCGQVEVISSVERDISAGKQVTWKDVAVDMKSEAGLFRREMEKVFG